MNWIPDKSDGYLPVGEDRLRLLRDGREAYPAMLAAIRGAREEICLEMYWVGADAVGERFRNALAERAAAGVRVRVIYDSLGSWSLPGYWWTPLLEAGGEVVEFGPVAPWRRHFRLGRVRFRDHRKVLVVDGDVAFTGGINLAWPWLPHEEGGQDWRDDAVEIRGPTARQLRTLFFDTWWRSGGSMAHEGARARPNPASRVFVLANMVYGRPDRTIRRAYLVALKRARRTVDIASAYFLPGPVFLHALRLARRRGVRVRVLVPQRSDVLLADLALYDIIRTLLSDGIDVFAYQGGVLHSKTAIVDRRFVTIGSHNLDTLSWRFNLESNVVVDEPAFARLVTSSFERDLREAKQISGDVIGRLPPWVRGLAWVAARLRAFL
ncbi:MAG: cardiolipin synthase ClsB [Myxococcales bacterium]|nr:cardiolipin synthase ClsB [Myxococcales bacterium]